MACFVSLWDGSGTLRILAQFVYVVFVMSAIPEHVGSQWFWKQDSPACGNGFMLVRHYGICVYGHRLGFCPWILTIIPSSGHRNRFFCCPRLVTVTPISLHLAGHHQFFFVMWLSHSRSFNSSHPWEEGMLKSSSSVQLIMSMKWSQSTNHISTWITEVPDMGHEKFIIRKSYTCWEQDPKR